MPAPAISPKLCPEDGQVVAYRKEYHALTDHTNATLLMSQVHYWYTPNQQGKSRLGTFKKGHWWIAKPIQKWADEIGLTHQQTKVAMDRLRKDGLVVTDSLLFAGRKVLHLRCTLVQGHDTLTDVPDLSPLFTAKYANQSPKTALPICAPETNPEGQINPPTAGQINPLSGGQINPPSYIDYGTDYGKEEEAPAQAPVQPVSDNSSNPPGEENMPINLHHTGKVYGTAMEKLADIQKNKGTPPDVKETVTGLYLLWASSIPQRYATVQYVGKFTQKQNGQVAQLIKAWAPDDSREILACVIDKWVPFIDFAEHYFGAFKSPVVPNIDYVCRYRDAAKNFWLKQSVVPKAQTPAPLPAPAKKVIKLGPGASAQLTAKASDLVPAPKVDDDPPMTMEELDAYMAELAAEKAAKKK